MGDPGRAFNTGELIVHAMSAGGDSGQHLFSVDDLLYFDRGTPQEQAEKQRRVVAYLLEFALVISSMEGYMGTKLDEVWTPPRLCTVALLRYNKCNTTCIQ